MIFPHAFNPKLSQYALTPFGRTAPLDVAGRKVLGITDLTASTAIYVNITVWMTAAGFVLFLVLAVSELHQAVLVEAQPGDVAFFSGLHQRRGRGTEGDHPGRPP